MTIKAGHVLLFSLAVIFSGCNMFEGVFKSNSHITVENNSGKEIALVEILLGKEVKKLDTVPHSPLQTQVYEVSSKSIYTIAVTFADGSRNLQWADVSQTDTAVVTVGNDPVSSGTIALSLNR